MKVAVSGKGGVGKTTISSAIIRYLSEKGYKVLAIDADPAMNLSSLLGFREDEMKGFKPLSEMKEFIEERTGAKRGEYGGFFKLNPKVDDIPDAHSLKKDGIKLLVLGTISKGGGGCFCPENVLLKNLLSHILVERNEWVVVDMDAGLEHLGRGTAKNVDNLIVVVEPGIQSLKTAQKIKLLANEIGLEKISIVVNKIREEQDLRLVKENLRDLPILGQISFSEKILLAEKKGASPYDLDEKLREEIARVVERLRE